MDLKKYLDPTKRSKSQDVFRFVILILTLGFLFLLLNQDPWEASAIPRYAGTRDYAEPTWVFKQGEEVLDPALKLPAFKHLKTGETYSISAKLTYDGKDDPIPACFFFVDHMFCRVTLDGREMFRYLQEEAGKPDRSRSPGNVYVSFQMPQDCLGKELVVEFIPALSSDVEFQLPNPSCGDYAAEAMDTFRRELPHNIVMVLFGFVGVVTILFSTLFLPDPKYREGMFIGIFAVLVSCYNLTESDLDFYIISNPYYTYVLDYTCFTLIPIFLMAFLRERLDERQKPMALAVILIGVCMFLTEMVFHFTGLMDMREFLPNLHIVYLIDFLIYFYLLLRMQKNRWKTVLILQMVPILLGILLDGAVYYLHWQLGSSDSSFTSLGILLFLVTEMVHVWKYSVEIYTLSVRSKDYEEMAYIDALTGIGNRRAFDAEIQVIQSGRRKYKSLLMVSADLNNLKPTNDNLGHAAGDFLIRSAAEVLAGLSDHRCHAFRVGGDEFAVLLYDMNEENFAACREKMQEKIAAINEKSAAKLSIAMGYQQVKGRNASQAIEEADKKMYEDKARIKAEEETACNLKSYRV